MTRADDFGHSDRTQLALLATRLPGGLGTRLDPLLRRGEVAVLHGLAAGLRFPAAALGPGHAHTRLMMLGDLEVPVQEALRRTVADGAVVYDVGANIGFFTLLAARLAGPAGRVLAFEPVAEVAAWARGAAARNGYAETVAVREEAVSAAVGTEALCVVGERSWSHLAGRGHHPGTVAVVDVPVTTLDAVLAAGAPPPDVIKLDVEGSETDVLRGAAHALAAHRPVVICELHGTNAEVADLFADAGYRVENLDGAEPVREAGPVRVLATPEP